MLFSFLATVVCIVCVVQAGLYKEPSESVYGFVKDEDHSEIEEAYEVVSVEESPVEMKQELQFPESSLITGYHDGRAVPMEKPKQDDFVDKQKEALPAERTAPKSEYTPERVEDIFQVDGQYSMNNQLNDYPPNKLMTFPLERASRVYPPAKHPDTYAPPGVPYGLPQPVHPLMYRGYPYVYGYPFDYRFGYAYGHAFGSDDNFRCPGDGQFYRDHGSFYICSRGHFSVQFCAPGSRNGLSVNKHGDNQGQFCTVNLVGSSVPLLIQTKTHRN